MNWLKDKMIWLKDNYALALMMLGAALIFLSWITGGFKAPAEWLTAWTAWVTSYVALAVAAYTIVKLANGAEKFIIRWLANNPERQQNDAEQGSTPE